MVGCSSKPKDKEDFGKSSAESNIGEPDSTPETSEPRIEGESLDCLSKDGKDLEAIRSSATEIVEENCVSCHGAGSSGLGNIDYIEDSDQLIASGKIFPGKPASESLFFARVLDGTMPPAGALAQSDLDFLRDYIEVVLAGKIDFVLYLGD